MAYNGTGASNPFTSGTTPPASQSSHRGGQHSRGGSYGAGNSFETESSDEYQRDGYSGEDSSQRDLRDESSQDGFYSRPMYAHAPSSESFGLPPPAAPFQGSYDRSGADSPGLYTDYESSSAHGAYAAAQRASREPYPAWSNEQQIPLSKEEIEDVFIDLTNKFGFQRDSMRNMYDHLMIQLDSRASRMSPNQALLTLHADYIGGEHANYRKWYFAAQLDLDDAIGVANSGVSRLARKASRKAGVASSAATPASVKTLDSAHSRWRQAMETMSSYDRVRQLALYLLCWGEAAQVRFAPECLCFIFKCADDYYRSPECQSRVEAVPEGLYMRSVVRPLYRFIRDQGYETLDGTFVRRERDHESIIGYDDINQLFWYPEGISRITLTDRTRLVDVPATQRFMKFDKIDWNKAFMKTYYERRSFLHMLVNFNRVWVLHVSIFWMYTAYNCPNIYTPSNQRYPNKAMQASAVALGGAVATLIMIAATLAEFTYVPTTWNNTSHLMSRLVLLLVVLGVTAGPTIYIAAFDQTSTTALIIGIVQFAVSIIVVAVFSVIPSGRMFGDRVRGKARKYLASQTFTASYPKLGTKARLASIGLWVLVFGGKLTESYFFLTLSFKNAVGVMVGMKIQGCSDKLFGDALCRNQAAFTLAIMFVLDLCLFFLDTFLWYVIWNTVYSLARSFHIGLSIWTPWKDIFERLPKRIYAKILATDDMEVKYKPKVLVSQIWNAIVISMYREHLLSIDHVQRLLYHQVASEVDGKRTLRAPMFFISQDKNSKKQEFFPAGSEAARRISFFAQSLTTTVPEPLTVDGMPTFTVLTPHYSEKILLSLREIIREEDQNTRVTLLEYLKQLHPIEWDNFVRDTKILADETADFDEKDDKGDKKTDDIPFYTVGFKSAAPEYTLRTRIWASLRAQTLYRTVSGFMNYNKAIKLLYRVENPEVVQLFSGNTDRLERELERVARRKFRFVVSMQRYSKFNKEEIENTEFLLRAYPDLNIAYLEEERSRKDGSEPRIYSCLIDGYSEVLPDGRRRPKFRVELPGNPILGDGKSDNQNHAIIFHRGEYLQLIDANQDNYLEECLKIRNILGEFEEYHTSSLNPYSLEGQQAHSHDRVAIVGAREYIFSENIGILGDVAAGKEQTFGTLAARSMAYLGGKLHYGHPDFLNAIYMTTRGGVSKAQKGLHLNEDIYAGMNAFGRGGRIKHTEYFQCGKGRDLGFGTILNFQTKIGTGMGEQMLSREYYYMGTQLPIDRFLTFYYGHPGFHVNNILVIFAVQLFMFVLVYLGSMNDSLVICRYGPNGDFLGGQGGCYNLLPVYDWIKRCIISIFIVFFIAFLPLFLQELTERGVIRAVLRLGRQFLSLSPVFEIFNTQILSHSILTNMTYGGARYIATGRGFATTRISFSILFSRFAGPSIYLGLRTLIMLLYITLTLWLWHLMYFWISVLALCLAPFIFNPHQFSLGDFIIDYREFLRWMSRGNSRAHANSWIGYCRLSRTRITGFKKKRMGHPSEKLATDVPRASWRVIAFNEVVLPVGLAVILTIVYLFVKSFADPSINALLRIMVVAIGPVLLNAVILLVSFFTSLCAGPLLNGCCTNFGAVMAGTAHVCAVIGMVAFFEFLWVLERWNVSHAVLGIIATISIQRAVFKVFISLFLSREFKHDEANRAWWTGRWWNRGMGGHAWSQPAREFIVKIVEMSLFSADFLAGHLLLFLLTIPCLIPGFDTLHSTMLFWLRPSKQIRSPIYSFKQRALRRKIIFKYGILYALVFAFFAALIVLPNDSP
ncbi:1,3-beta-D-glucan synthase [Microbotryomycetes sp. JL221]|nr:1,3-beta-D-glucan synthase [Microbotryomycetes sp. JL221]